jgi:tripartite-type tricarboxylate transporter receptor subunit TctC
MRRSLLTAITIALATAAAGMTALPLVAHAQPAAYPNKPLRMIVPYPPGGGTDGMGRLVAERLSERLGQTVTVVNVAGASGTVGSEQVRRADPDGYTLLFNASLFVLGKNVVKATPYDPLEDFTPLARMGQAPVLMVAAPNVAAANMADVLRAARANPTAFNMAISSQGSAGHLATLEFQRLANLKLQIIPYKGTAPAVTDIMGGSVQLMLDSAPAMLPQTKGGKLKGIAITGAARSPINADIPTMAEAGLPALNINTWYGVWAPKGLPPAVQTRLVNALAEAARSPEFKARLDAGGLSEGYLDPAAFMTFMKADQTRAVDLLRAANFQPE